MSKKRVYYRIQPAGLAIRDHQSVASADDDSTPGIDVFLAPTDLFRLEAGREDYGDEVLVIVGDEWWDNEDAEGVRIDPRKARIVNRFSWEQVDTIAARALGVAMEDLRDRRAQDREEDAQRLEAALMRPEASDEVIAAAFDRLKMAGRPGLRRQAPQSAMGTRFFHGSKTGHTEVFDGICLSESGLYALAYAGQNGLVMEIEVEMETLVVQEATAHVDAVNADVGWPGDHAVDRRALEAQGVDALVFEDIVDLAPFGGYDGTQITCTRLVSSNALRHAHIVSVFTNAAARDEFVV